MQAVHKELVVVLFVVAPFAMRTEHSRRIDRPLDIKSIDEKYVGIWPEILPKDRSESFMPVAPIIPDEPYIPRLDPRWVNGHQDDWSRHIKFEPDSFPLIRDLTGVHLEQLPFYNNSLELYFGDHSAWCQEYRKYLLMYGMNGAVERFSTQESHGLGNVFARQVKLSKMWVPTHSCCGTAASTPMPICTMSRYVGRQWKRASI